MSCLFSNRRTGAPNRWSSRRSSRKLTPRVGEGWWKGVQSANPNPFRGRPSSLWRRRSKEAQRAFPINQTSPSGEQKQGEDRERASERAVCGCPSRNGCVARAAHTREDTDVLKDKLRLSRPRWQRWLMFTQPVWFRWSVPTPPLSHVPNQYAECRKSKLENNTGTTRTRTTNQKPQMALGAGGCGHYSTVVRCVPRGCS